MERDDDAIRPRTLVGGTDGVGDRQRGQPPPGIGVRLASHNRARAINHTLGFGIILLVVPAIAALVALRGAGWLGWVGPAMFVVFVALMVWVDYLFPVEFRSPQRPSILAPYLVLFFGSILLMGLQMYAVDRRLWLVTGATTALHLGAMGLALMRGVG